MTNLDRLKIELNGKQYYTDEQYSAFLLENNLVASDTYLGTNNTDTEQHIYILHTVKDILETLANNIDYFRNISTEFVNTSAAYKYLKDRIDSLNQRIMESDNSNAVNLNRRKTITYTFFN